MVHERKAIIGPIQFWDPRGSQGDQSGPRGGQSEPRGLPQSTKTTPFACPGTLREPFWH